MIGNIFINGVEFEVDFPGEITLLELLRDSGHTEVKAGCHTGECGACVVLLDGELVNSCQVLAGSCMGAEVTTVKGIGDLHDPHPIQQALVDTGAVQCGFCTPGIVLASYALLEDNPNPGEDDIKTALDGNLCRCTGYVKIIEGVKLAAERTAKNA
ncbi:MAG TPA: (2Fe-2S)-binding protein [candidate division Zixibacteria bacterium]|nr:(2Fe-2S)-binding protein [candidate division Zixibacteria bacterium]